uniref:Pentatricopeptide repeat protein n=1 Tax=Physcomitrium patens TaxID=3218 RepID=N0DT03_PHYPA|nr:pentatricopeptide repeat protein [Physcomitrium patens]
MPYAFDVQAQRVRVGPALNGSFLNGTVWPGRQFQRSCVYSSFFFEGLRDERRNHLRRAHGEKNVSGETDDIEHLWKKYFAGPFQWWDNTANKKNDRVPDYKHKVTGEALWIVDPSTPQWAKAIYMKAMLMKVTQSGRVRLVSSEPRVFQGSSQFARKKVFIPNSKHGKSYSQLTSTSEWRQTTPVNDAGLKHLQNATTLREAIAILQSHVQHRIPIDSYMYVDVLQRCLKQKDLESAKQLHDCIIKSRMEQNLFVANKIMRVYNRCGRLQDARKVFDKLEKKNVVTWTTMIGGYAEYDRTKDAIKIYNQMRQEGGKPDKITYLSIMKACVSPPALKWGKEIHTHIRDSGFQSDVHVGNALTNMYTKSGSIDDARMIFEEMVERDVISWNVMIGGLAQHGRGQEAFDLFLEMQRDGFVPDATTYISILNANASTGALDWIKEVHEYCGKSGLDLDVRVGSALVHMYAKSGSIDDARLVFNRMIERNVITWNAMIGGLARHGYGHECFALFLQMQREGFVHDEVTYLSILSGTSATAGDLKWVKKVHSQAVKAQLDGDIRVGTAFVHMLVNIGSIDDAKLIFDGIKHRDIITWNVMIGGLAQHRRGHEAYSLFSLMQREGFVPNVGTYISILNTCASSGALEWLKEVHKHVVKMGLDSNISVENALIHMYAKSGSIDDARLIFEGMAERDVASWNGMIGGLAQDGHEAFSLFLQRQREGVVPNPLTYVSIPSASAGIESGGS